jgi:hypothetical protein
LSGNREAFGFSAPGKHGFVIGIGADFLGFGGFCGASGKLFIFENAPWF